MSWVTIDEKRCNRCGMCAKRCPLCFSNRDGVIVAQADETCCNLCGHCVALCAVGAVTHHKMDMANFPPLSKDLPVGSEAFLEMVRRRRSYRSFRDRPVPREDIEKLLEMVRYCPTGSNMQSVQVKVITRREGIRRISEATVAYFQELIARVQRKVERLETEGKEIPQELKDRKAFVDRYARLARAWEMGIDPILHGAPLVLIFHSPPNPSTPQEDCIIAAQTVVLGAMTLGLGSCYIGLVIKAAFDSPAVLRSLELPEGNTPYGLLVLGYPKLKFHRAVDRKPLVVQWEE
jgi:nitroreductase/NAD-dependent dihydropyrimidine dehydrogenase PreA subunit